MEESSGDSLFANVPAAKMAAFRRQCQDAPVFVGVFRPDLACGAGMELGTTARMNGPIPSLLERKSGFPRPGVPPEVRA